MAEVIVGLAPTHPDRSQARQALFRLLPNVTAPLVSQEVVEMVIGLDPTDQELPQAKRALVKTPRRPDA